MQLFAKINSKTNVINVDDNENNKLEKIIEIIEELTNFNRNCFLIKIGGRLINSDMVIHKESNIEVTYKSIPHQKLYVENNVIFYIPRDILLESKVIVSLLDPLDELTESNKDEIFNNISETNKLMFSSNGILDRKSVNDWINISFEINKFLTSKGIKTNDLKIPRPLTKKDISTHIGKITHSYLDNMILDDLKKLATLADYLDISYLLEVVCAFIAEKFVKNKSIEEIKSLNLI